MPAQSCTPDFLAKAKGFHPLERDGNGVAAGAQSTTVTQSGGLCGPAYAQMSPRQLREEASSLKSFVDDLESDDAALREERREKLSQAMSAYDELMSSYGEEMRCGRDQKWNQERQVFTSDEEDGVTEALE